MKSKLYALLLLITSLLGYLEWSGNEHVFLFQAEVDIFSKLFSDPLSILHPFTILPILGQLVLLITLFQEKPRKALIYFSISTLSILLVFMFIVGILAMNFKIIISTIPFILMSLMTIRYYKKKTASINS